VLGFDEETLGASRRWSATGISDAADTSERQFNEAGIDLNNVCRSSFALWRVQDLPRTWDNSAAW